jgi:hypothetical protein
MYVWNASETDIRAAAEASGVAIFGDWAYGRYPGATGGITRTGKTDRSALHFRLALGTERQDDGYVERDRDEHGRLIGKRQLHPIVWQRRSASYGWGNSERRVAAVCWHGHYAFMRYLLALRPDARIKTSVGDYRGLDGFLRDAPETAWRNIGSQMYPLTMAEACFCHDYGNDYLGSIDRAADEWASERLVSTLKTMRVVDDATPEFVSLGECGVRLGRVLYSTPKVTARAHG